MAMSDTPGAVDSQADTQTEAQADAEAPAEPTPVPDDLAARVEAGLMIADRPMTAERLGEALHVEAAAVREAVDALNDDYGRTGRSFRIEAVAGGYRVLTLPDYADVLATLDKSRGPDKLSAAAVETLAIVAYKQPIVRAEIESIRGVACGEVLRALMERRLIKVVGRAEEIGRPMLYGTTRRFLEVFGLASLKDLPMATELRQ